MAAGRFLHRRKAVEVSQGRNTSRCRPRTRYAEKCRRSSVKISLALSRSATCTRAASAKSIG